MKRLITACGFASLAWSSVASADESPFAYTYGAETLPAGETELELWLTDRRGKSEGHYNAQDYRIELEHGITNRFSISGYANFASHHIRGLEPELEDTKRNFGFQGLSAEFKYNVLSPYKDPIGLTVYAEPGWSRIHKVEGEKGTEYELELKAILQKNFMDDKLVWATNFTLEPEWEREVEVEVDGEREVEWEKELSFEVTTGLSYRFAPNFFAGVEGRYHSEYPDWTEGLHREHYALFAGPTVHYAARKWWVTASWLPQIHGSPHDPGRGLHLDEHEQNEFRVKVGYEF